MRLFGDKLNVALREQEQNLDVQAAVRPITLVGELTSFAAEVMLRTSRTCEAVELFVYPWNAR